MTDKSALPAHPLILAFAPLHRRAMGTAVGVAFGSTIFVLTLASIGRDAHAAQHIGLLAQFFVGYSVSLRGALVGVAWGFATGYVLGWSFALLHNVAVWIYLFRLRMRAEMEQYGDFFDHM